MSEIDRYLASQNPRLEKVARILQKYCKPRLRFLDVGCGPGVITSSLVKELPKDIKVYGVDISKESIENARSMGFSGDLCDLEKDKLPYPSNFFDVVHAGEVIEHIVDTDHFLDEIWRVLRINGILIISTPNLSQWAHIVCLLLNYQPRNLEVSKHHAVGLFPHVQNPKTPFGHVRAFTYRALKELLMLHKFEVIETHGSYHDYSSSIFIKLANKVCDLLFTRYTAIIILVARKKGILNSNSNLENEK